MVVASGLWRRLTSHFGLSSPKIKFFTSLLGKKKILVVASNYKMVINFFLIIYMKQMKKNKKPTLKYPSQANLRISQRSAGEACPCGPVQVLHS